MTGHIHIILKDLVISEQGHASWSRVLGMCGFRNEADVPCHELHVIFHTWDDVRKPWLQRINVFFC